MKNTWIILNLALGLGLTACSAPKPQLEPASRQVSWVENYSSAEVTVRSTGVGAEPELAVLDLRKAALWWIIEGGTDPILNTPDARAAFENHKKSIYDQPARYITWEADGFENMTEALMANGQAGYKATKKIRINREILVRDLTEKGVIASKEMLSEAVGMPNIMVLPEAPKGQTPLEVFDANPLAKHAAASIESYLTARKYDVIVPRAADQINQAVQLTADVKGIDNDPAYTIALAMGSDIYFTFAGEVTGGKASVQVKAYETTTGRLLGTETGYSHTRPNAPMEPQVEEAISATMNNVLQRVQNYWIDDMKRGLQYKVVLKVRGNFNEDQIQDIQDDVERVLKTQFSQKKSNIVTDKTMDYLVWADRKNYSDAAEVERAFRQGIKSAKIRKISVNKKLILLAIDNP